MKTINAFRATNAFCISGTDIEAIGTIVAHFAKAGARVDWCAHDKAEINEMVYTVRVTQNDSLRDLKVQIIGSDVRVLDSCLICEFGSKSAVRS